ncbi:Esterase EstB [Rubripirellula amarantea]|uniref:Esterase EstB n=1 Tax=Rubripirellula amarantea TaxID=2527999 RepID=A0A5C5WYE2_9BACT|nr:serine hydrolase domain-containing protein [Rubripirellula amarantea]TWT54922.1 Esterase EstB [Rubripirellula amarantea]
MNHLRLLQTFLALLCSVSTLNGQDMPLGSWEQHGFSLKSRDQLQTYLAASVEDESVPGGIVIVIHQGEVVLKESFGYRHIKRQLPFELDTPFHAASLSKSIISTLVVALDADGSLDLDQPIDAYLPMASQLSMSDSQPATRMPTLRECLHHTGGFIADEEPGGRPWLEFRTQDMTLEEAVELELRMPLARQPGSKFAYSGIGYDIAGRIVEVVTGKLLEEVLQERLCQPLGMTSTTYYASSEQCEQMASFYWRWRSDGFFRRQLDDRIVSPGKYASVGGGIVTTADDLAKFMLMHRNGGRVDGKPWTKPEALLDQYRRKRPGAYYGIGFTLGPANRMAASDSESEVIENENGVLATWILHTGSSGTMFWLDRSTDTIGIIVTQQRYSSGEAIPESEKVIAKDAASWQQTLKKDWMDPILGWRPLRKDSPAAR